MRYILITSLCLLLVGCIPTQTAQEVPPTVFDSELADVDYKVGLAVYVDGLPLDLSKEIYINKNPQIYLTKPFPGIVFVKKSPLTWQDFFDKHTFSLDQECLTIDERSTLCSNETKSIHLFLNGAPVSSINSRVIEENDRLLISYGDQSGIVLERQANNVPKPSQIK